MRPFPFSRRRSGDPYFANVSALLHFNGANGSTTFTDQTGKVWTPNSTVSISTAQSKFGGASGVFGGGWLTTPSHADFGFGTGDYTIEAWVYRTGSNSNQCLFDNRGASSVGVSLYFDLTSGYFGVADNSSVVIYSTGKFAGTWYFIALVRDSGTLRLYVDGVQEGTAADSRTYAASVAPFIGDNYAAPSQPVSGYVDASSPPTLVSFQVKLFCCQKHQTPILVEPLQG